MAQNARTDPLPGAGLPAGPAEATAAAGDPLLGIDRLTERLWHLLTSMRVALVLILGIAGLALIGTVLIQAPPGVLADPQAKASWLAEIRPKYGGWTSILDQLQLFAIFQSLWFRALAALLVISLIACVVHRANGLWRTAVRPRVNAGESFFEHAPQREMIVLRQGSDDAIQVVREVFRRHRYRTLVEDDGTVHLYADRNRWGPLGSLAGHLSLLIILAGAVIGSTFGFSNPEFMVAEGFSASVPSKTDLTLKLEAFRDSYYTTTGAPSDFASDLILYKDGAEVARKTIRVNDPLRYEDVSFFQSFYGPAALMTVADASGKMVFRGGVPLAWSEANRRIGSFTLPEAGLTAWVVGTSGPQDPIVKPGQMRVELYAAGGGNTPIAAESLDQAKAKTVSGLTFTFEREIQFTGLSVASDPGTPLVWLGCFLLIAGFAVVFLLPHRRIWGRIVRRPGGGTAVSIASINKHDVTFDAEFTSLVSDIRQAFHAPVQS